MNKQLNKFICILKFSINRKQSKVSVPYSNINIKILSILFKLGFIKFFQLNNINNNTIDVCLKYTNKLNSCIKQLNMISKNNNKIYVKRKQLMLLNQRKKTGIFILSTTFGLITSQEAYKLNIGGEVLLYIQ